MLLWLPTSSSKFLSRRDGRPSNGPVGRILRPGIGTRCGRRGSASANDLPDRHKAGPRHMGRSQLNGWLCRGWKGLPTSSLARGSLTPDTPGRAFSLTGLGTNGLGSRSSDPGNDVCVHACSSAGPVDSAMSVCARCRFPALIELDGACKKSKHLYSIRLRSQSRQISRTISEPPLCSPVVRVGCQIRQVLRTPALQSGGSGGLPQVDVSYISYVRYTS